MGVRVVFIMNFVVGWVVLATVWSSIDAGRLETDGWQEMAVATFLVGCSALMFEEWLCRKRPLRLKTRAFLLRSALLHAVYMALAFELNRMMTLLHGVYLMHGFAHGSLITAVLRWLQALVFTLPFSMAFTAPAGVLVGLANGLLLRAREADASASSRRLAQILVGLVILLVTVAGLQLVHGWRVKVRTLAAAQRALHELPMPPRTALVYREYKGCIPCRDARVTAVYATDLSPEEVCEAYRSHLSRPGWDPSPDGCQGRHVSGGVESARFHARQPPDRTSRGVGVTLTAFMSSRKGPYFMGLSLYGEGKAIPRAKATGATFYSIDVLWIEDKSTHDHLCPPNASGACNASNSWFLPDQ